MAKREKIMCSRCGTPMNHHADKLVYETSPARADDAIGDVVLELHQCPTCGEPASRPEVTA